MRRTVSGGQPDHLAKHDVCCNAVVTASQFADQQLDRLQILFAEAAGCKSTLGVQYCLQRGGRNVPERCEEVGDAPARRPLDLCVDFRYENSQPGELPYHVVLNGSAILEGPASSAPVVLQAGDIVLLPHGSAHALHDGSGRQAGPARAKQRQRDVQ